jgi:hypothetical protein
MAAGARVLGLQVAEAPLKGLAAWLGTGIMSLAPSVRLGCVFHAGGSTMRITLTVTAGPHEGREYSFAEHDTFIVGRSKRVHFQLLTKNLSR